MAFGRSEAPSRGTASLSLHGTTYVRNVNETEENDLIRNYNLWLLPVPQILFSTFVLGLDCKEASQIIYKDPLEG